jgi:integrase
MRCSRASPLPRNQPMIQRRANQPDLLGLRDRALIAMMVYSFARIGAVIQMKVGDYFVQGRRRWVRLHEKGGKEHDVPCHHRLDQCLHDYIEAAGIADDVDGYLFRSAAARPASLRPIPSFSRTPTASSAGARKRPASRRALAIIPFARPALRRILRTAASWKWRSRSPTMNRRGQPSFMTAGRTRFHSTR